MSIVEKALSKLRKVEVFAPQVVTGAAARPSLIETEHVVPRGRLAAEPKMAPPTIHLDGDRLRAAGLAPAPDGDFRRLADEMRRLKWALLKMQAEDSRPGTTLRNTIMISSAVPNEGKSFTSYNLALTLATEGERRVWLIDADTVRQQLSRGLGIAERPGLLDVIADPDKDLEDVLTATDVAGLFVISSGTERQNAPELIGSGRMTQLLGDVASRYEDVIVIFDTAPILATSVPQALAPMVGRIVITVRADHTPRHAVLEAITQLRRKDGVSLVLTHVSPMMRHDYYSGYYDYANKV